MSTVTTNRRARFDFDIKEHFEAGLMLTGSEVKSLRDGNAHLSDAYAVVDRGEAWLLGSYIAPYAFARDGGHEPTRRRKLLLHRREIDRIASQIAEKGLTFVPMKIYFKDGRAKMELGLGKGKRTIDKRETIKERQQKREMDRAMRDARRR